MGILIMGLLWSLYTCAGYFFPYTSIYNPTTLQVGSKDHCTYLAFAGSILLFLNKQTSFMSPIRLSWYFIMCSCQMFAREDMAGIHERFQARSFSIVLSLEEFQNKGQTTSLLSLSHNHGSGKYLYPKGNYYWRDPFLTSMIMGGSVVGGFSPTHLNKYAPQNGSSSPRFGVRIKNIWNHHLVLLGFVCLRCGWK